MRARPQERPSRLKLGDRILGTLWIAFFVGSYLWMLFDPGARVSLSDTEIRRAIAVLVLSAAGAGIIMSRLWGFVLALIVIAAGTVMVLNARDFAFAPTLLGRLFLVYIAVLTLYCSWRLFTWRSNRPAQP